MGILLGAIADDFTGATDLANMLVTRGMRTLQTIGVPDAGMDTGDAEAVIIALKSRTAPVRQAVDQSLAALAWLQRRGAQQFFFKYCSTFEFDGGRKHRTGRRRADGCAGDRLRARLPRLPDQQADDLPGPSVRRRPAPVGLADEGPSADADAGLEPGPA